eukprot:Phypoly_transcript_25050.p1 GENE.Phypoly_transcript_25050~~Phypoly_transcript_25050.p1  ORF type:complete len:105 (+),score=9.83 Phypoly_transcript_25050:192-506(+)
MLLSYLPLLSFPCYPTLPIRSLPPSPSPLMIAKKPLFIDCAQIFPWSEQSHLRRATAKCGHLIILAFCVPFIDINLQIPFGIIAFRNIPSWYLSILFCVFHDCN